MALFFLSYDLRNGRDYERLYDELERFNAVCVLESQWCFNRINTTCSGLRTHFRQFIDSDDGISIAEVSDWATYKALSSPNKL